MRRLIAFLGLFLQLNSSFAGALAAPAAAPETVAAPESAAAPEAVSPLHPYRHHPAWSELFTEFPENYLGFAQNMFNYEWPTYAAVAGSTLALMPYDHDIFIGSKDFAMRRGIMDRDTQERVILRFSLFGKEEAIRGPRSLVGLFWYFGDGMFSTSIAAGLAAYGYSVDNYRATQVALQIFQSLTVAGPTVLALKLLTGREAPSKAEAPGGNWHGYPGLATYARNQARYYAFPSGHTTAAVSTLFVLAENYPEQTWILPTGGVMVGLLMFALMNVESHWPSDFPLALLLGYTSAKTVVSRAKEQESGNASAAKKAWLGLWPHCEEQGCGFRTSWRF